MPASCHLPRHASAQITGKQLRIERPRDYAAMPDTVMDDLRAAKVSCSSLRMQTNTPCFPASYFHTRVVWGIDL